MRYFAFLEITKGISRKNSLSRPQESCFKVEIGFSCWRRRSLRLENRHLWLRIYLHLMKMTSVYHRSLCMKQLYFI